jgi:hypothetical protein
MGDVPSWLAAIGTVGAFAIALLLLWVQMSDRRKEAGDRRMAQARLVAAWLSEMTPAGEVAATDAYAGTSLLDYDVLVRNGSEQPVYMATVQLVVGVRGTCVRRIGVLGPGETRELRIKVPGEPRGVPFANITFADSAGQVWMRSGHAGELTRPSIEDGKAILQEDPGAYPSLAQHPTVALGQTLQAQQGRRVSYP